MLMVNLHSAYPSNVILEFIMVPLCFIEIAI